MQDLLTVAFIVEVCVSLAATICTLFSILYTEIFLDWNFNLQYVKSTRGIVKLSC